MSYISVFYLQTYREKAKIAHANSMMALAIGTWAPLHRSPSQQSISHLVIFIEGEIDLQFFAPQLDELVHPLAKASTDTAELSSFRSALPQRS